LPAQDDDDREDSERAEPAQGHGDAIVHRRDGYARINAAPQ
jgi:hypothetical protein